MAKQTFTTGQVLTSAQMTALQANDYNQTVSAKTANYVLVAADAGTRVTMSNAGATTITVNTSLFTAGDTLFITNIGAGATTITAGTATVSTISSLVLAQYDSGTLYFTSTGVAIWQKYQGAASSSGSMTLLSTTSLSGTSTTISSIVGGYRNLYIYGYDLVTTAGTAALKLTWNGFTIGTYGTIIAAGAYAAFTNTRISNAAGIIDPVTGRASLTNAGGLQFIFNAREYTGTTGFRMVDGWIAPTYSEDFLTFAALNDTSSAAITSFTITTAAGTQSLTGTIKVYGVN